MTPLQQKLSRQLQRVAAENGCKRVVYRTEYLGYLPFGQYYWITVDGRDVSLTLPHGWQRSDLEVLVEAGTLLHVSQSINPQDLLEVELQYEVASDDGQVPGEGPCK